MHDIERLRAQTNRILGGVSEVPCDHPGLCTGVRFVPPNRTDVCPCQEGVA